VQKGVYGGLTEMGKPESRWNDGHYWSSDIECGFSLSWDRISAYGLDDRTSDALGEKADSEAVVNWPHLSIRYCSIEHNCGPSTY
jgi:hypothetical protein